MAKVKRKVPTVDLIRNQKVPSANPAGGSLMGSAISMGAGAVPNANLVGAGNVPTIDSLSQQVTQQEMVNAAAIMGPTQVDNKLIGGFVENVGKKPIKVKRKK